MKRTFVVNVLIVGMIVFATFLSANGNSNDITLGMGIGFLLLALANLFIGVVLLLASIANPRGPVKHYATSMLLVTGISLLCSLTFCSTSSFSM